ncbi:glutathione synthetase ATP-binding protein [Botrytis cinerea]
MDVTWRAHLLPKETSLIAIDVFTRTQDDQELHGFQNGQVYGSSVASKYLNKHLEGSDCVIRLLLPTVSGYLVQSDFLDRRLVDCNDVVKIQNFTSLDQHFEGVNINAYNALGISDISKNAIGAIATSCTSRDWSEANALKLDEELTRRFSFAWHSAEQTPKRRLAVIRPGPPSHRLSLSKLEDLAIAAASLNIVLIFFDDLCHGLAGAEWAHLREDFVPMDMALDEDMPQRIASAVSAYPKQIDGIIGMYEPLLTIVAEAATLLGFSTSSPKSVYMARDKYQTRQFNQSLFCYRIQNISDLEDVIARYRTVAPLSLPLIVKPANGWASEGVCKVTCEDELRDAVLRLWQPPFSEKYGRDTQGLVLVEPYVDGPEVDANLVLVDGEIVFFEVNDDFPSSGDSDGQGFVETLNAMPSALPEREIDALRLRSHATVLAMGFKTGIFHVEARVHNSTFDFTTGNDNVLDLSVRPEIAKSKNKTPTVFILEVNPRPPGMRTHTAIARTYGVSYRSIALLTALEDHERLRALAVPFVGGAQYDMQVLFIAAQKGGVYQSGDVCSAILEREPHLSGYVKQSMGFLHNGQEVPDPRGRTTGIACFWIASRGGRREARLISEKIQELVWELTDGF